MSGFDGWGGSRIPDTKSISKKDNNESTKNTKNNVNNETLKIKLSSLISDGACLRCLTGTCKGCQSKVYIPENMKKFVKKPIYINKLGDILSKITFNFDGTPMYTTCTYCFNGTCKNSREGRIKTFKYQSKDVILCYAKQNSNESFMVGVHIDIQYEEKPKGYDITCSAYDTSLNIESTNNTSSNNINNSNDIKMKNNSKKDDNSLLNESNISNDKLDKNDNSSFKSNISNDNLDENNNLSNNLQKNDELIKESNNINIENDDLMKQLIQIKEERDNLIILNNEYFSNKNELIKNKTNLLNNIDILTNDKKLIQKELNLSKNKISELEKRISELENDIEYQKILKNNNDFTQLLNNVIIDQILSTNEELYLKK